jgi:hypothetical protein
VKKAKKTVKKTKAKPTKSANKKPVKAKAKPTKPAKKVEPEETMDRKSLKSIVTHLKDAGVDIKVLKSDTDDALQKKVAEALQKLPPSDLIKKLEGLSPEKLLTVLKQDCLGIFIDLSDVSCVRCKDAVSCAKQFIGNLKGGFKNVQGATAEPPKEKAAAKLTVIAVTKYKPSRLVFVRDRPNPNKKGSDYYDTIAAILKEEPSTLEELREIVERDFDIDSDLDFMKFVTAVRDPAEGVVKLDVDLSENDKKSLREAGYDV